jgi:DNA polymerase alpha-associated DNA helicase A
MAPKDAVDIPSFATTQLALLEAELQSELSETSSLISNASPTALQKAGLAITNLSLSSQRTGLGGKTVVELGPDSATASKDGELAEHGVRTVSPNFLGASIALVAISNSSWYILLMRTLERRMLTPSSWE